MAKRKKSRQALWLGLAAVGAGLAVLLALVLLLPKAAAPVELPTVPPAPETTAPPPATSPFSPNPYTAADFLEEDGFLTCTAPGSRIGIDVSSHQGDIDWAAVAESPVDFAMLRVGYRGYESGILNVDDSFRPNYAAASETDLDLGVYFFSQAISPAEAVQEAKFLLAVLKDRKLQLPVVYDWEYISESARTGSVDAQTLTECALAFCRTVEEAGYEAMVYFNTHIAGDYLELEALAEYDFWLAQYELPLDFPHRIRMWQYSESGTVPGIEGNVDLNIWLP